MSDAVRRTLRTIMQLAASGALTALVNEFANGLPTAWLPVVMAMWQVVVTYAQNALEDSGAIPAVLKAPASDGADPLPDAPSKRR